MLPSLQPLVAGTVLVRATVQILRACVLKPGAVAAPPTQLRRRIMWVVAAGIVPPISRRRTDAAPRLPSSVHHPQEDLALIISHTKRRPRVVKEKSPSGGYASG